MGLNSLTNVPVYNAYRDVRATSFFKTCEPVILGPIKHSLVSDVNTAAANESFFYPNTPLFGSVDALARALAPI